MGVACRLADAEIAEFEFIGFVCRRAAFAAARCAAQQCLDARQQQTRLHRFGDVIVGAELQAEDLVEIFVTGGQHQDDALVLLAHGAADLEPVLARQHDIQNHQIRIFLEDAGLGRIAATFDSDFKFVFPQIFSGQFGEALIVLDQQNACRHGGQYSREIGL